MDTAQLHGILLVEAHRYIVAAAAETVEKLGKQVPEAAIDGYIKHDEQLELQSGRIADFNHPVFQKSLKAGAARASTLSYPPDGTITAVDAQALESLKLKEAQAAVLKRVVAEAAYNAFFHFFALLDSVGDPELTHVRHWEGARFTYANSDGDPMLHDELGPAYYEYRKKVEAR